jgi:H+/gluconate symporter-like permease
LNSFASAEEISSISKLLGSHSHFSKLNFRLLHGAILRAIIAASIAIVPEPQNISYNGSLYFQPESTTSAAARFSFIGASHVISLYQRLCKPAQEEFKSTLSVLFSINILTSIFQILSSSNKRPSHTSFLAIAFLPRACRVEVDHSSDLIDVALICTENHLGIYFLQS